MVRGFFLFGFPRSFSFIRFLTFVWVLHTRGANGCTRKKNREPNRSHHSHTLTRESVGSSPMLLLRVLPCGECTLSLCSIWGGRPVETVSKGGRIGGEAKQS